MDPKISAVLKEPELMSLKTGLDILGAGSPALSVFQTDLEALQIMYMNGRPDVLIMDLDLPSVIGLETVKAMRQQAELATLPLILISSKDLGISPGVLSHTLFLVKPVLTGAWKDAIKRSLSGDFGATPGAPVQRGVPEKASTGPPPGKDESRKAPRKPWETPCIVGTHTRKLKAIIRDISSTGARVTVDNTTFAVPSVIILTFAASVEPLKIMQMRARLVRKTKDGYGVQFLEMDGPTRFFINKLTGLQSL